MSAEFLSGVAGIVLSLMISYIPPIARAYAQLTGDYKRLVMAVLLIVVALAATWMSCTGLGREIGVDITCDTNGFFAVMTSLITALTANQAVYALTRKSSG